jgi:hypothetical protein
VDDKTGNVLVGGYDYDENGGATVPVPENPPSSTAPVMAVATDNGYGCLVQSANNSVSCYDLIGGDIVVSPVNALNLGSYPEAIAMGTFGAETDAFVVSENGTPSLYEVRAADAYTGEEPALPLPGVTPLSTVQTASFIAGGWQVIVFDSGPASGTIAVLSTYDRLLLLVNESTWTVTKSVKLSGTPFRIATDMANGTVIIAYANPASVTTTYASVDALSGTETPLTSKSSLLSVGLVISSDGTKLYSSQRNQMDVELNQ